MYKVFNKSLGAAKHHTRVRRVLPAALYLVCIASTASPLFPSVHQSRVFPAMSNRGEKAYGSGKC